MSKRIDLFKITIGSCKKFIQLAIFANKFVCTVFTDLSTNPSLLKIDINVRFTMTHVSNNRFFQNLIKLVIANLCDLQFLAIKFVFTVLTDLQTPFC